MFAVKFVVATTICRMRPLPECSGWSGRSVALVANESAVASFTPALAQGECRHLYTATGVSHG